MSESGRVRRRGQLRPSRFRNSAAVVGFGALLAACGTGAVDDEPRADLTPVTGTEYVTVVVTTTTTTTTLPPDPNAEPVRTVEESHTIVAGDSLARLSSIYDVPIETICSYNGWSDCIEPPHLLLPGDIVRIPPETPAPPASGAPADGTTGTGVPAPTDAPSGQGCTHTIQLNQTPSGVANRYGITLDQLQAANPSMDFRTTFVVGDTLTIPPEGNC